MLRQGRVKAAPFDVDGRVRAELAELSDRLATLQVEVTTLHAQATAARVSSAGSLATQPAQARRRVERGRRATGAAIELPTGMASQAAPTSSSRTVST